MTATTAPRPIQPGDVVDVTPGAHYRRCPYRPGDVFAPKTVVHAVDAAGRVLLPVTVKVAEGPQVWTEWHWFEAYEYTLYRKRRKDRGNDEDR